MSIQQKENLLKKRRENYQQHKIATAREKENRIDLAAFAGQIKKNWSTCTEVPHVTVESRGKFQMVHATKDPDYRLIMFVNWSEQTGSRGC